jgi:hypothetical protein
MTSVLSIVGILPRLGYLRWNRLISAEQGDLVIAGISVVLVGSVFEGFFLGILSFAVVWLYALFTMTSYLFERSSLEIDSAAEDADADADAEDYELEPAQTRGSGA